MAQTCVDAEIRTTAKLPLEEENLKGLPRHWVQVCTNDIFYSDGVCYVHALRSEDVEVRMKIEEGWPHTFWLKAGALSEVRYVFDSLFPIVLLSLVGLAGSLTCPACALGRIIR